MTQDDQRAPVEAAPPQRVLGGRYLLEERIASGGMATVWRAHDETLARTVAVKSLHEHLTADEALRERFRREAVAAAKLGHPGIVGIYDTGARADHTYLVMEYVEGETLREVLAEHGRLDIDVAAAIGVQVADALGYAHARGLVHRDVKPANILVGRDGGVKIADFGIAKVAESARDLTQTGTVLGTAAYVAPEQVRGDPVDGRADQYGLACVLYESLTGRRPFEAESPMAMAAQRLTEYPLPMRAVRPDVPRGLDDVVMRALARDVNDRYDDVRDFGTALGPWAASTPAILVAPYDAEAEDLPAADGDSPDGDRPARSFLRSEGTWLAPVIALLVVAATLVGVGLATGVLEADRVPSLTASDQGALSSGPEPATDPIPVAVEDVAAFDPAEVDGHDGGDGVENDEQLPNLLDGDPDTTWRTERYDDTDFGNLKPGVGVVLDLGASHRLASATVETASPGISYELRVADEPHDTAERWTVAAEVTDASASEQVTLSAASGRYVLLYVVPPLVEDDDGAYATISGVELQGEPQ